MYTSFYNLSAKPFQIASDPNFIWLGEKHKEALATLTYGVMDSKGFMLLTGDVGTGKTTLINTLIKSLSEDVIYASVPDPRLGLNDFLNYIANAFDIRRSFKSKGKFLIYFSEFLAKCAENNKKVLLLIDEAQLLTQDMLEEIRLLSNIQKDGMNLLNIFFVGQDEFNEILDRYENRAVAQRITLNYHLKPLTDHETEEYIKHRLNVAGMDRQVFDAEAFMEIFRYSGGFPRRINILCDHCLLTGFVREQQVLGADVVQYCAQELRIPQAVRRQPVQQPIPTQPVQPQPPVQGIYNGGGAAAVSPSQLSQPSQPGVAEHSVQAVAPQPNGGRPMMGPPVHTSSAPPHPSQAPQPHEPLAVTQPPPQRPMPRMRSGIRMAPIVVGLSIALGGAGALYWYDRPLFDSIVDSGIRQLTVAKERMQSLPAPQEVQNIEEKPPEQRITRPQTSTFPPVAPEEEVAGARVVSQPPSEQVNETAQKEPAVKLEQSIIITQDPTLQGDKEMSVIESKGDQVVEPEEQTGSSAQGAPEEPVVPELPEKTILVRFNNDSSEFYFADFEGVDSLVAGMKETPGAIMVIAGHTDSFGSDGYNYRLSLFRANMVKSFFLGKGIPSHQLKVKAFGSERPVATNETEEGRAKNRRVEIDVML